MIVVNRAARHRHRHRHARTLDGARRVCTGTGRSEVLYCTMHVSRVREGAEGPAGRGQTRLLLRARVRWSIEFCGISCFWKDGNVSCEWGWRLAYMCCAVACEGVPCLVVWGCVGRRRGGKGMGRLCLPGLLPCATCGGGHGGLGDCDGDVMR